MTPLEFLSATAKALEKGAACTVAATRILVAAGYPPTPAQEAALALACLSVASGVDFKTKIINTLLVLQSWLNAQSWAPSIVDGAPISTPSNYTAADLGGLVTMAACANTHSSKVQGAGICCAQVGVGLTAPPKGTTLPAYQPGQANAGTIPAGRIVQVTDAGGHCASCMIVGSTSRKHPGKPVLKFVRGGPACPTAGTGCCSL
jgi:hypothetical protein